MLGSNAWPQYDLGKIVELSIEMGAPVIGIGIKCVERQHLGMLSVLIKMNIATVWASRAF